MIHMAIFDNKRRNAVREAVESDASTVLKKSVRRGQAEVGAASGPVASEEPSSEEVIPLTKKKSTGPFNLDQNQRDLTMAIINNDLAKAKAALDAGADLNSPDYMIPGRLPVEECNTGEYHFGTALELARKFGRAEIISLLEKYGAE